MSVNAINQWWTCKETAAYLRKSPAFVRHEIKMGRLRAARVGSRRDVLCCAAWCDAWVSSQADVHMLKPRRVL